MHEVESHRALGVLIGILRRRTKGSQIPYHLYQAASALAEGALTGAVRSV